MYLFLERGRGGEERKRNINVWLPLAHPLLGTRTTTQACALTGNRTSSPLVPRPATLNPLNNTSQGIIKIVKLDCPTKILHLLVKTQFYIFHLKLTESVRLRLCNLFFFLNPHLRTCLLILERGKGRKRDRERNINAREARSLD